MLNVDNVCLPAHPERVIASWELPRFHFDAAALLGGPHPFSPTLVFRAKTANAFNTTISVSSRWLTMRQPSANGQISYH